MARVFNLKIFHSNSNSLTAFGHGIRGPSYVYKSMRKFSIQSIIKHSSIRNIEIVMSKEECFYIPEYNDSLL